MERVSLFVVCLQVYNESFRDQCVHTYKNIKVENPEWTVERIKRHLLFQSGGESGVFDQVIILCPTRLITVTVLTLIVVCYQDSRARHY